MDNKVQLQIDVSYLQTLLQCQCKMYMNVYSLNWNVSTPPQSLRPFQAQSSAINKLLNHREIENVAQLHVA